jgi:hypothetical protein
MEQGQPAAFFGPRRSHQSLPDQDQPTQEATTTHRAEDDQAPIDTAESKSPQQRRSRSTATPAEGTTPAELPTKPAAQRRRCPAKRWRRTQALTRRSLARRIYWPHSLLVRGSHCVVGIRSTAGSLRPFLQPEQHLRAGLHSDRQGQQGRHGREHRALPDRHRRPLTPQWIDASQVTQAR